jgi:hypothetical protein
MSITDQTSLLHLMETGIISETKVNKRRQMQLKCWVFATSNSYANLIEPLLSRFVILIMPEYSFDEFIEIASGRLRKRMSMSALQDSLLKKFGMNLIQETSEMSLR